MWQGTGKDARSEGRCMESPGEEGAWRDSDRDEGVAGTQKGEEEQCPLRRHSQDK